eukprot:gene8990-biopygen2784
MKGIWERALSYAVQEHRAVAMVVVCATLQVDLWSFGGRTYPVVAITVAEAAVLRSLAADQPGGQGSDFN